MKRKITLSFILIFFGVIVFSINTVLAETYDIYTYTVSNDKVTITDCPTSTVGTIIIPETINGYSVTSIGSNAFYNCSSLTNITIPGSVTSIGSNAFYNCSSLTNITIPENVTSIGRYAFYNCSSLTNITIPGNVTKIEDYVFYNCNALTDVNFPDNVTSIGDYAFYNCNLSKIALPKSPLSIGNGAFWYSALTEVSFSSKVVGSVMQYGNEQRGPFYKCTKIKKVVLQNDAYIRGYILMDMTALENIEILGENVANTMIDGILYNKDVTKIEFCPVEKSGSVTVPGTVIKIDENTFENRKNIAEIILKDGITAIGENAFSGCVGLTRITIPSSVTSIGSNAFYNCSSLTNITIPENVTSIQRYAFYNCSSLTNITIPGNVTSIGDCAFYNCNLSKIVLPENLKHIGRDILSDTMFFNNEENWCEDMLYIDDYLIAAKVSVRDEFTIKNGTKIIANNVFSSTNLSEIILPDGLQTIGDSVFYNCDNLTNITIPNSVTSIGSNAFYDCDGLVDIVIPGGVENINSYMFYDCDNLLSVTLEDGVTTIGDKVFYNCDYLRTIIIPGSVTETMGFCAIYGCTWLTDVYYGGNSWYDIYDNKYNLHFDGCGRATLKYFRNVTILDANGNTVDIIRKDLNSTLVLSDISLEKGQYTRLYTDKELNTEYSLDTPITEHLTLYVDIKYTTTNVSEDGKTFTVNAVGLSNGNTVIFALYNEEGFTEMQFVTYEGDEITFTTDKSYTNAKIMVWESLNNLIPVTQVEIVK